MSVTAMIAEMNKQERIAWLGAALFVPVALYLGWRLFLDPAGIDGLASTAAQRAGARVFMLFLLGYGWIRWKGAGRFIDERDLRIAARAAVVGYLWLALTLIAAAHVLGLESFQDYVRSRSLAWLEAFLMFGLVSSGAAISCTRAVLYWRDRR
ncbi:hypothetical protein [Pseudoxanthomonas mexicana]|uniref:hypothetical protein n=1 Tax=Pseudoxanthomonas mexicana TaxID=128785 RepID=UPI00398A5A7E